MTRDSLLACALGLGILACDGGGGPSGSTQAPHPSEGSGRHIQEIQAVAHASGKPAQSYGVDRPHTSSEVEKAILARVDEGYRGDLTHDPALSAMVRDLAISSPSRFDMPPTLLDALLAWHGIPDPEPAVVVVELEGSDHGCDRAPQPDCEDALAALVEEVHATLATVAGKPRWRYGVGVASVQGGAKTRMMVALVERAIELEPIPVSLPGNGKIELKGTLLGKRHEPRVERVDPRGHWARLPAVVGNDGSVQADIRCDAGNGAYQVEVLADGKLGPEVVANFKVFCGVERPSEIRFGYERLGPKVTSADVVRGNFDLLNAEREARGLPILAWDDRAAMVAKAHSEDMLAHNFVGHVSPRTGDAGARFERAGISGIVVRENVARGYGPKGIHESLMNSPGHRANLLATDVSHVGIGVVFGEPESSSPNAPRPVFLTQNFYSKPGADVPAKPSSALRDRVDAQRVEAGKSRVHWNNAMNQIAQRRADGIAGLGPGVSDEEMREQVAELRLGSLEQHQVSAGSFEGLVALDVWLSLPSEAKVGVGVAAAGEEVVMVILVGR